MQKHEVFFVIPLYGLIIRENIGKGDKLDERTFISNDHACVKDDLTAEWQKQFGEIDTKIVIDAPTFVYGRIKLELHHDDYNKLLEERLHFVGLFLSALWLVKDNPVNMGFGYLRVRVDELHRIYEGLHLSQTITMADGSRPEACPADFSRDELRKARELFRSFTVQAKGGEKSRTKLLKSISPNRVQRAHYFLQASRSTSDVGMRIAMYCTALEALFGTDNQELSHRLSERVAVYIGTNDQRFDIYQNMKRAYKIRSEVLHGVTLKEAYDDVKIEEISRRCDQYLRECLIKSLNDEVLRGKNEEINEYFLKCIFPNS